MSNKNNTIFDNFPDIIRASVAAKTLGISVSTLYDWKYRGQMRNNPIPDNLFIKLNRTLYINTEVLRCWVASEM